MTHSATRQSSYTLTESGTILTETDQGYTQPADYLFSSVNDFVNGTEADFEDLQALCLGMATHLEGVQKRLCAAEEKVRSLTKALHIIQSWARNFEISARAIVELSDAAMLGGDEP